MGRGQGGGGRGGGGGGTNSMGRVIGSNTGINAPGVTWGADIGFDSGIRSLQPGDSLLFGSRADVVRRVNRNTITLSNGERVVIGDLPRTFGFRALVINNQIRPIQFR